MGQCRSRTAVVRSASLCSDSIGSCEGSCRPGTSRYQASELLGYTEQTGQRNHLIRRVVDHHTVAHLVTVVRAPTHEMHKPIRDSTVFTVLDVSFPLAQR